VTACFKRVIIRRAGYSSLSKQSVMSVHKIACFLSLNRISELVGDKASNESGAPSNSSSEDEGGFKEEPGVSHLQTEQPTSRRHASTSSLSSNASDDGEIFQSGSGQQVQTQSTLQWTRSPGPQISVVGPREEGHQGNEATHITWWNQSTQRFPVELCGNDHTAGDGD
jgi:hypothetical protein